MILKDLQPNDNNKSFDEAQYLYDILDRIFKGEKLNNDIKEQLDWDYHAHENPYD